MIFHSPIEPVYFVLPLLGLVIGLFGTILGGGGGFFFLPILTLILGVPAQTAVITSLAATLPICLVGSVGHYRKGNIDFKTAFIFTSAGVAGAFAGAAIAGTISTRELKAAFGIYSVIIALNMALNTWKKNRAERHGARQKEEPLPRKITRGSFFGLLAGTITGLFGVSATAPVLAGLFTMRIPLKMVIGTSLLVILINTLFAVSAHFLIGQIDLTLVWFLTSGSAIGALIGPGILAKTNYTRHSENKVRYAYATAMVMVGILMIMF